MKTYRARGIAGLARLAGLATVASVPLAASPAWSACVPDGAGIPSGVTVTCSGTDTTGVGNGTQSNVTANVQQSAAITLGDNSTDINLLNANAVLNNGALTIGNASGATTVANVSVNNNNNITNAGSLTAGSAIGPFSKIDGILANANNTVVNNGQITIGSGTGLNSSVIGISAITGNTVTNNGTITAGSATGPGSFVVGIDGGVSGNIITNNGTITVGDNTGGFATVAAGIAAGGSAHAVIINNGTIRAGAEAFSIFSLAGFNPVTNNGTLDGMIDLAASHNLLTNAGLITITDAGTSLGFNYFVNGTFTQTATGTLAVRVNNAGANDTLQVLGTANLGGTLGAVVPSGLYANTTKYIGVVQATNPITAQFAQTLAFAAGTTTPLVFFTVTPTYNATSVDITLNRIGFGAVAGETTNQQAVGNALSAAYSTTVTGSAATRFSTLLQATSTTVLTQNRWRERDRGGAQRVRSDERVFGPDARSVRLWPWRFFDWRRFARLCAGSTNEPAS
jgi:hypothetical protein